MKRPTSPTVLASLCAAVAVSVALSSSCGENAPVLPDGPPPFAPAAPPSRANTQPPGAQPRATEPATPLPPAPPLAPSAAPQSPVASPLAQSFAPLVDAVKASVVNVEVTSRAEGGSPFGFPSPHGPGPFGDPFGGPFAPPFGGDPFGNPFGVPEAPPDVQHGIGSGVIIDASGRVLTNNHVVEGATSIRVTLEDGRTFDARILGRDPLTDLAVIQLEGDLGQLPVAKMGDSDALRVGDWVVAIGNPFGLASSVSVGIVSAKARVIGAGPYDQFLQTDAAINPGNSGGPLFNLNGEVVGVTTIIVGGGAGIGFAVPSNDAKALMPQLQTGQAVTRGWLGVAVQDLTEDLARALGAPASDGAVVGDVTRNGPADKAGLQPDDVILELDGQKVESASALTRNIAAKAPGTEVRLGVFRRGGMRQLTATLGTRPDFEGLAQRDDEVEEPPPNERLGLAFRDMDERLARARGLPMKGALVVQVEPGSPADRAGIGPGEVIIEANARPIASAQDLRGILAAQKPGSVVLLRSQTQSGRVLRALSIPDGR